MLRAMRQIWITRTGTPEVLELKEAPDPEAGAGQVRVRARASGINFADLLARVGLYPDAPKLPCVVGDEITPRTSTSMTENRRARRCWCPEAGSRAPGSMKWCAWPVVDRKDPGCTFERELGRRPGGRW
jgi:hypothetical protein